MRRGDPQDNPSDGRAEMLGRRALHDDRSLETKGLLKTSMGEATAERGRRAKRMVRVTPKGIHEVKAFYQAVVRVRGTSWSMERAGSRS